jgi:uncharacterized protein (DUF3084 family)
MSDVGLILILMVLVLGGVIATIGDRLGTRVGKARLSLFNLRPKSTATVVTILTGTLISASTLGVLFVASRQFREMVLSFGRIQTDLRQKSRDLQKAVDELKSTTDQKSRVEQELAQARSERAQVEAQLKRINADLKTAVDKQKETNAQLNRAEAQRVLTQNRLTTVSEQALKLKSEIEQLQAEREVLAVQRDEVKAQIAERDEQIAQRTQIIERRDQEINDRDRVIAKRGAELKRLEENQAQLKAEVEQFEQEAQQIRSGFLAILRTQVLSYGVLRVVDPNSAKGAVDRLLQEANRVAIQSLQPGTTEEFPILKIPASEVAQLIDQINDGQDYVVRVMARANYVRGESRPVAVYMNAVPNRVIFQTGETVGSRVIEPAKLSPPEFQRTIQELLANSNALARQRGILNDSIQLEKLQSLGPFLEQLRRYPSSIELRAVATDVTYTVGPLKIELVAVQNGQIVLRTSS